MGHLNIAIHCLHVSDHNACTGMQVSILHTAEALSRQAHQIAQESQALCRRQIFQKGAYSFDDGAAVFRFGATAAEGARVLIHGQ
jgi:hypothetical protein